MGRRVVYEVVVAGADARPVAVLFSNSSHPTQDPRRVFAGDAVAAGAADASSGPTGFLGGLLEAVYATPEGGHRVGDRLFHLVADPYGDCESVTRATFRADGSVGLETREG